jgi:transposase InsO family protein
MFSSLSEPSNRLHNGTNGSVNGQSRAERLAMNWFYSRARVKVNIEAWHKRYNEARPRASLESPLTPGPNGKMHQQTARMKLA